jgi:DNA-binding transcriptional regulator YiaG
MTKNQYRAALDRLGLTQAAVAEWLKVDERTSRRWALGEVAIPEAVAKLLRYMVAHNLTPEDFP